MLVGTMRGTVKGVCGLHIGKLREGNSYIFVLRYQIVATLCAPLEKGGVCAYARTEGGDETAEMWAV